MIQSPSDKHGLLNRLATDGTGSEWRFFERSIRILESALWGECWVIEGEVAAIHYRINRCIDRCRKEVLSVSGPL